MIYQIEDIINDLPFLSCLSVQRTAGTCGLSLSLSRINHTGESHPCRADHDRSPFLYLLWLDALERHSILPRGILRRTHRLETPSNEGPSDHRRVGSSRSTYVDDTP